MSKYTHSTSNYPNTHSSSLKNRFKYVSPLEKLDRLTDTFQPKRVLEEKRLEKMYQEGKCEMFRSLSTHRYYFINHLTSMEIIDNLIDLAKNISSYTLDTEDQLEPSQRSKPALLQIEYVYENNPSILLLIEMLHLSEPNEPSFTKIKQLLKIIFSNNHQIHVWGDIKHELKSFYKYNLFDKNDIDQIIERNIQNEFKTYFNRSYPSSPDIKLNPNDKYSLQFAVHKLFNEWLTKRFTLGNFGSGLDPSLGTIKVPRELINREEQVIRDEQQIRQYLVTYALNDCLSVTKIASVLPPPTTTRTSTITNNIVTLSDDALTLNYEPQSDDDYYDLDIRADDDINNLYDDKLHDEYYVSAGGHVRNDPLLIDDDDIPIPEIMIPHFNKQPQVHTQQTLIYNQNEGHVQDDHDDGLVMISDDEQPSDLHTQHQQRPLHEPLTRNQKKSRKKRAKRYRYEVFREVYYKFSTNEVKNILIYMNIHYVNINPVGHIFFVGVKDEKTRKEVEEKLNVNIFTKEHYQRIHKRTHRTKYK